MRPRYWFTPEQLTELLALWFAIGVGASVAVIIVINLLDSITV